MRKVLAFLRDPVWQMLGVVVGVIAIFIAGSHSDIGPKELVSIHVRQGRLLDQWMPGSKIRIQSEASNYDPEKVLADYFLLHNFSSAPIMPTDFVSKIEVTSRQGAMIKEVRSCSQSFAQACSADGSTTPTGGAYVLTEWKQIAGKWTAEGPLINKDDSACIVVISETPPEFRRGSPLAELSARVKDYNFRFYDSPQAHFDAKKRWYHSLYTAITFEGPAVYWLVVLTGALMLASYRLLQLSRSLQGATLLHTLGQVGVSLLCLSTSEILTDIYFNHSGRFLNPNVHLVIWPLLAAHAALLILLVILATKARRAPVRDAAWRFPEHRW